MPHDCAIDNGCCRIYMVQQLTALAVDQGADDVAQG
jgi:hypothetical protein